jgi:hypothetical protein
MIRTDLRLVFLAAVLASACNGDANRDEAPAGGVVTYPGEPDPFPAFTLQQRTVVCPDDEKCQLVTPAISAVGPNRRVVLGGLAAPIVEVDSGGQFVRTVGRFGGGPGEFRWALAGDFDEKGQLRIYDTGNNRLTTYNATGGVAATTPVEQAPPSVAGIVVRGGSLYVLSVPPATEKSDSVTGKILLFHEKSGEYREVAAATVKSFGMPGSEFTRIPDLFSAPQAWDVDAESNIFWSTGSNYEIHRFAASGERVSTIKVGINREKVTQADIDAEVASRLGSGPEPPQVRAQLNEAARNAAKEFPAISHVRAVRDGVVWVRRFTPATRDSARWDAFSNDKPFGTVRLPAKAQILAGNRAELLILNYDSLDVPVVAWYDVAMTGQH